MKNIFWIFTAILLFGCAYRVIDLPVASGAAESQFIRPISKDELNMIRCGNVLIVNKAEDYCRDVLVFDGYHSLEDLIVIGSDGLPAIDCYNIGRFSVAPASGGKDRVYGEILVGNFRENQNYTFLITTQSIKDGCSNIVCYPQIYQGRIERHSLGEKYRHPVGDVMVEEFVYNIVYLPEANISFSKKDINITSNALSIDSMLGRGIYRSKINK